MSDAFAFGIKVADMMLPGAASGGGGGSGLESLYETANKPPPIRGPLHNDLATGGGSPYGFAGPPGVLDQKYDPARGGVWRTRGIDPDLMARVDKRLAEWQQADVQRELDIYDRDLYDRYARSFWGRNFGPGGRLDLLVASMTDDKYKNLSWSDINEKSKYVPGRTALGSTTFGNGAGPASPNPVGTAGVQAPPHVVARVVGAEQAQQAQADAAKAQADEAAKQNPGFFDGLGKSISGNPWLYGAAGLGLGGLGAYGLYQMMAARREKKKRLRELQSGFTY